MSNKPAIKIQSKKSNLTVFDADGLLFLAAWEYRTQVNKLGLAASKAKLDRLIQDILSVTQAEYYLGFFGDPGSAVFRHDFANLKPYKGNRTEEDWQGYFKPRLKEHMREKWKFVGTTFIEADDSVCIAFNQFKDHYNLTIVGEDKDMKQFGKFTYYNPRKHEFFNVEHIEGRKFFYKQMIMGDSTDHIGGLPKHGPKSKYITYLDNIPDEEFTEEVAFEIVRNAYVDVHKDMYLEYMFENFVLLNMLTKPAYDYPKDIKPLLANPKPEPDLPKKSGGFFKRI